MKLHRLIQIYERSIESSVVSFDSLAFLLLLVSLFVVPFPFGAVLPAGTLRLELLAYASFLAAALSSASFKSLRPARKIVGAALLLLLLGCIQLAPMGSAINVLSAGSARVYREAAEIISLFGSKESPKAKISISAQDTTNAIVLTGAYLAFFLSAAGALRTRWQRRFFAWCVCASGALQIVFAVNAATSFGQRAHGTFVNPNHFAAFLEPALAMAGGILVREIWMAPDRGADARERSKRLEKQLLPIGGALLMWSFLAAGMALSRSRGAVLATSCATVLLFALAFLSKRRVSRRKTVVTVTLLALAGGVAFVIFSTGSASFARLIGSDVRDLPTDRRLIIWRSSLEAWRNFPIFGSGLGTFRDAFRAVQPRSIQGIVEYAHSDALQILVSGGLLGFAAAATAVGGALLQLFRGWMTVVRREESALTLASFAALVSLLLHGLVEFNLSVPAIAALLAMTTGLGFAAIRAGRKRPEGRSSTPAGETESTATES